MKKIVLLVIISMISIPVFSQSKKPSLYELSNFPEDYIGDTLTYKNIWWWPVLKDFKDRKSGVTYYQVQLDLSGDLWEKDFGMGGMATIMGATTKKIAKKLTSDEITGYSYHYFGDVTGHVIEVEHFGSDYFFVITRIVYHQPNGNVIKVYE